MGQWTSPTVQHHEVPNAVRSASDCYGTILHQRHHDILLFGSVSGELYLNYLVRYYHFDIIFHSLPTAQFPVLHTKYCTQLSSPQHKHTCTVQNCTQLSSPQHKHTCTVQNCTQLSSPQHKHTCTIQNCTQLSSPQHKHTCIVQNCTQLSSPQHKHTCTVQNCTQLSSPQHKHTCTIQNVLKVWLSLLPRNMSWVLS